MKIHEAARLSGVSERTLRYYDRIGLLPPQGVTEAGYRIYGEAEMARLQEILFFRELGFELAEIRKIMTSPGYDRREALRRQREMLVMERNRLSGIIELAERALKGETNMGFAPFDRSGLEEKREEYAREARERWGNTPEYAESERRTAGRSRAQQEQTQQEMEGIFAEFAALRGQEPGSAPVQALVEKWQAYISAHFYECSRETLAGLGQMYTADERFMKNIDRAGEGTAALMSAAIAVYCAR